MCVQAHLPISQPVRGLLGKPAARCRLENRRWLALYVVGITLLLGAMLYLDYLHTMVIEYDLRYEAIDRLKSFILPLLGSLAVNFRILTK